MKVLFVCSGNSEFRISPIVKAQGESLKKNGIEIEYFLIKGKGIVGYLKNILPLRKYLKNNNFDIIHAHYALCGWVAVLANKFKKPIIVSYMGSDTYGDYDENGKLIFSSYIQVFLAKILQLFVNTIIVKSKNLERYIYMKKKVNIIPNGVDCRIFEIIEKNEARNYLKLDLNKKYILFLGDKENKRKNYQLLQKANIISKNNFEIINPYPTEHDIIPYYLNACDLLVSTSFNEGSPNVIKEAMACNCPIVSTDVGDVKEVIGNTEGCYITSFDPEDVADKLRLALKFGKRTNGRDKIKHLDSNIIAKKIIKIYEKVLARGYGQ